ncbi:MAG: hypothetical protein DME17_00055 [Candidatus Rokuibacteriota bacterium]|nr:MAG: hypothetical protein DME17_00055 [Candidatus Rokubacteria bacterium]
MSGREQQRLALLAVASALMVLGLLGALVADVGRPFPGFLFTLGHRIVPVDSDAVAGGLRFGDRIVTVDGASPITLASRIERSGAPVSYEIERDGRHFGLTLAVRPFTWMDLVRHFGGYFLVSAVMLLVGVVVFVQNRAATPNRRFLVYMCLWAVANAAIPEGLLGPHKYGRAILGFVPILLSVHGWILFLTYPANPVRQAWLERHRLIPRLYWAAAAVGVVFTIAFAFVGTTAPAMLEAGPLYPLALDFQVALALVSFPIKILALLDTRRRAASPLVNQQTTVLLLGIGLGLGLWLGLMLLPLTMTYPPPVDPQIGSALVLLYPLAIAYATVRYRLFDAALVIRRSVVYTALAVLIAGSYALALAGASAVLAQADLARSPWFFGAFMFAVALGFYPVRERLQRAVDRTFFRERYDAARTFQTLARSMTGLLDLDEITRRLTQAIEATLHATNPRLLAGTPPAALAPVLSIATVALSRYQLAADPDFAAWASAALGAYRALEAEVVVPLRFQERLHGLLLLGPKRSEAPYTAEDLALLETLADQTAVAVANAEAHRQVVEYARQLERSLLIRTNLAKFVPQRVRQLIEESPEAPSLDKRETEVTVLFADITGYTRLSSRLPQDTLDALVERYFGAFLDEIVRHGGDVNETAGDGLMVIFHEGEHPRAAVRAAQAIQRRAYELNAELAGSFDPLVMHVGVNTGLALLGATKIEGRAGTRWTYTASGLTTNIAARLASMAEGGQIVVSESTLTRLDPRPPADDLGVRELKNVERPLRLYRLLDA